MQHAAADAACAPHAMHRAYVMLPVYSLGVVLRPRGGQEGLEQGVGREDLQGKERGGGWVAG